MRLEFAARHEGFQLTFRLEDQYQDLVRMLTLLGVRHIHYHHLLGHDPVIMDLPSQLGVRYDFTAHDFYSFCAHISLTGKDNRYAPELAPGECACCSPQDPAPTGTGTVADWRHRNRHFLIGARLVMAPSHDTARRMAAFVPGARVRVIQHTDIADRSTAHPSQAPNPTPLRPDKPLKIAVLGALSAIKGADVLEATALHAAQSGAPLEFHLLGYGYRHLQTQPRARLTVHGAYQDEDLAGLLTWLQPDIVWFPAVWPETYSYTLSAAMQAGLPVAVPDLGAFAERVADRPWSWVCPWDQNAKQWVSFFTGLCTEHFAHAAAPLPSQNLLTAAPTDVWSYACDYLDGVAPASSEPQRISAEALKPYAPKPSATARSSTLDTLVYMRSLPLLSGVARAIPTHWQRRVKNWLQK